ncbi:STE/STE11/CDC15 protein kinase [Thecamonas trahens ATCC 50062]|uniref:STE/STE11/CDC15 protein kinase n=1 Tax=Thecamonas trahens ATCC 50062 TaxID=461836 RepID=A0A0L0DKN6_THETB|nr:STE/STE11/CDC15 protein kinase [Thecamonas trahens ATCC 50062]KNC52939.1 STE/STE11/CDC15 protein kinase [Thecamonas trahens ATCC 50062]|eukprot:XP_013754834.1 STE/STE11/CDC15 protein kinase [Thecamonas trahens ATCC 50062]
MSGPRRAFAVHLGFGSRSDDQTSALSTAHPPPTASSPLALVLDPRLAQSASAPSGGGPSISPNANPALMTSEPWWDSFREKDGHDGASAVPNGADASFPSERLRSGFLGTHLSSSPQSGGGSGRSNSSSGSGADIKLGRLLGSGAFGSVYQGLNIRTGIQVAVKVLNKPAVGGGRRTERDAERGKELAKLKKEVDLLRELNHVNIVSYFGTWEDDVALYIMLDYVEGGSLAAKIKEFGTLPEPLVAFFIAQVVEGLAFLHAVGVLHRDIKGANILLTKEGVVKLTDFGIASSAALDASMHSDVLRQMVGTPCYIAPEVIAGEGATPASDVYSLACTIVEMVAGKPPFADAKNLLRICYLTATAPTPIPDSLSPLLQDLLRQAFVKDPAQRLTVAGIRAHPWMRAVSSAHTAAHADAPSQKPLIVAEDASGDDPCHLQPSLAALDSTVTTAIGSDLDAYLRSLVIARPHAAEARSSSGSFDEEKTLTMSMALGESLGPLDPSAVCLEVSFPESEVSAASQASAAAASAASSEPIPPDTMYATAFDDSLSWSSDEE